MVRSMYSGVSGLRSHQTMMDVIGNNIANVNTYGYKASRATFKDIYYQTMQGASAPTKRGGNATGGGSNPNQVGYGVAVNTIDTMMTQSGFSFTDNGLDVGIAGEGFFQVQTPDGNKLYTRAGILDIDADGNLVDAGANFVLGVSSNVSSQKSTTKAAEGAYIFTNTNANVEFSTEKTGAVAEAAGVEIIFDYVAKGTPASAAWAGVASDGKTPPAVKPGTAKLTIKLEEGKEYSQSDIQALINGVTKSAKDAAAAIPPITAGAIPDAAMEAFKNSVGTIKYSADGKLKGEAAKANVATIKLTTPYEIVSDTFTTHKDPNSGSMPAGDNKVNVLENFDKAMETIHNEMKKLNPTMGEYIHVKNDDFKSITISKAGEIVGNHSKYGTVVLGRLDTATFANPRGLSQEGSNYFAETGNSGKPKAVIPGTEGGGALAPGALELSNVDLSKEFSNMITTQRGFQANSRIITVSDEMLQELVNLKR